MRPLVSSTVKSMKREKTRRLVVMTIQKLQEAERLIEYERYGEAEEKIAIAKIALRKIAHEM
jgi:hypothetical protein